MNWSKMEMSECGVGMRARVESKLDWGPFFEDLFL